MLDRYKEGDWNRLKTKEDVRSLYMEVVRSTPEGALGLLAGKMGNGHQFEGMMESLYRINLKLGYSVTMKAAQLIAKFEKYEDRDLQLVLSKSLSDTACVVPHLFERLLDSIAPLQFKTGKDERISRIWGNCGYGYALIGFIGEIGIGYGAAWKDIEEAKRFIEYGKRRYVRDPQVCHILRMFGEDLNLKAASKFDNAQRAIGISMEGDAREIISKLKRGY